MQLVCLFQIFTLLRKLEWKLKPTGKHELGLAIILVEEDGEGDGERQDHPDRGGGEEEVCQVL